MQNTDPFIIAIDGTAASGKGTLAKKLADHLGFAMLDTGLLYRRIALTLMDRNISLEDKTAAIAATNTLDPATLQDPALRGAPAGRGASVVAAIPEVRQALIDFQRGFPLACGKKGAVIDGRDIGTVIFPDAPVKFFVDAKVETRAERRHKELTTRGDAISYDTVLADMKMRDARDAGRLDAPMIAAADAVLIDSTTLDAEAVFASALRYLSEKFDGLQTEKRILI